MTIAAQIRALKDMNIRQLREKYEEVWGEPTKSRNKDFLFRKIAWRIQELAYGGISERAKKRAFEIAKDAPLRIRPPRGFQDQLDKMLAEDVGSSSGQTNSEQRDDNWDPRLPMIGSAITKIYKGRTLTVMVRGAKRFEFEGKMHTSLSAIAREVTGSNYNGFSFFGLNKG